MSNKSRKVSYRTYWYTWVLLLAVTVGMILIARTTLPSTLLVFLLLAAMIVKAGFICATFMHLRFEKAIVTIAVVGGIIFTALMLFGGIAADGVRVLHLSAR